MISKKRSLSSTIFVVIIFLLPIVFCQNPINVNDIIGKVTFETNEKTAVPYYSLIKDNNDGTFYLGSSGYVYKVNLSTFKQIWSKEMPKEVESGIISCEDTTPDDKEIYWCENQISVVEEIVEDNELLICGTNSGQPRCWNCTMENGFDEQPTNCILYPEARIDRYFPSRPDFDSTWFYNRSTGLVYAGTEREPSKDSFFAKVALEELWILNPPSRRSNNPSNENWLNMPAFVGEPVLRGDYIYFFFRETATEYKNAGKIIYSRVGRICANNNQSPPPSLNGFYQTLVKARLNCSIDLDFPFYFNEIQDVYMSKDNDIIYGVFTTPSEGPPASAVCAYSWMEIENLFDVTARYKGQDDTDSDWLPKTYQNLGLTDRPGTCGVSFNSDDGLTAINKYNLINQLVPSIRDVTSRSLTPDRSSDSPLLYKNNYRFNSIVKVEESDSETEIILMIGTNDLKVLKAHFNPKMGAEEYGSIVSEIELGNGELEVRDMITYTENDETYVIATAVNDAFKIPVVYCEIYKTCEECRNAEDPDCVWKWGSCIEKKFLSETEKEHDGCYITSKSKKMDIVQAFGSTQHVSTQKEHSVNFYALVIARKGCNFVADLPENVTGWTFNKEEGTATDVEFFAIRFTWKNDTANNVTFNLSCSNEEDCTANLMVQVHQDGSVVADCSDAIYLYDSELARYEYELTNIRQKILGDCYHNRDRQDIYQCPSFTLQENLIAIV